MSDSIPLEQIQKPESAENVKTANISESTSIEKGSGKSKRRGSPLRPDLCADATNRLRTSLFIAHFHLEVLEKATAEFARKIKKEANTHCKKIKDLAMEEIRTNERPSSEVLEEYSQMLSDVIREMEEQLSKLVTNTKTNVHKIEDSVLSEVIGTMEKELGPRKRNFFLAARNARNILSLCRASVTTIHEIMGSIVFLGFSVYALCEFIIPYKG